MARSGMEVFKVETVALADAYKGAKTRVGESSEFYRLASNGFLQEIKKVNEMWDGEAGDMWTERIMAEAKNFSRIAEELNELVDTMNSVRKIYNTGEKNVQNLVGSIDVTVK